MIQDYLDARLKKARYELIDDGTRYYGEIIGLRGVWAIGKTRQQCRLNLTSALESWLVFRLRNNLPVPNFRFGRSVMRERVYA